ncbi:predicted protein [Botrytis cinerea T4]|uniref:Uncharacterized protein n=1 Tax=Botryotinia fuckeliana (strain T4) TaxID=999810 RepID=G2YVG2_BOTF4|nr:predicted protein [Botrytis cinerea T4]
MRLHNQQNFHSGTSSSSVPDAKPTSLNHHYPLDISANHRPHRDIEIPYRHIAFGQAGVQQAYQARYGTALPPSTG